LGFVPQPNLLASRFCAISETQQNSLNQNNLDNPYSESGLNECSFILADSGFEESLVGIRTIKNQIQSTQRAAFNPEP
jgi:hypothetical protein